MKKFAFMFVVSVALVAFADTWTDPDTGYTWTYRGDGDWVEIRGPYDGYNYLPAISPLPTGAVSIPSTLGGKQVKNIGERAFAGCSSLTDISIPDSVTEIKARAFLDCSGLQSITVPNSVTSIELSAFAGCGGLRSMTLPFVGKFRGNSETRDAVFGYIFGIEDYEGSRRITQTFSGKAIGSSEIYYIPRMLSTVTITGETKLGRGAFSSCIGLKSISMGGSLKSVESGAFSGCTSLTNAVLPDTVTDIGESAFSGCSGLASITLPTSLTSISKTTFMSCSALTSMVIPNGVTHIGDGAFLGCSNMTVVEFPDSLTGVGESAFANCSSLDSVYITGLDSWCRIAFADDVANPFCFASKLYINGTLAKDINYAMPAGVTSIGNHAFRNLECLVSVKIPDSVTSIGTNAFRNCQSLETVTIGDGVLDIRTCAFLDCSALSNVKIGNGVLNIGPGAFRNCASLASVTIPDSVTNIGDYAFGGCASLTSVTVPNSVRRIGSGAFSGCCGLNSMTLPFVGNSREVGTYKSLFGYIFGAASFDGATQTDQYYSDTSHSAFYVPASLKTVVLTDQTTIGYGAFYNCTCLEDVTLPSCLQDIGSCAFYNCTGLESVTIPRGVTGFGENVFFGCPGLNLFMSIACDEVLSSLYEEFGSQIVLYDGMVGGSVGWFIDRTKAYYSNMDSSASWKSGTITDGQESWLEMDVTSAGRLSFWWKASSESDGADVYDYAYLSVDGVPRGFLTDAYRLDGVAIGGKTDWSNVVIDVTGDEPHKIRWTYRKDDVDEADKGDDCIWLDDIAWMPKVSVSYDILGASGVAPSGVAVLAGATLTLPYAIDFSKAKHTFAGWSDGSRVYNAGEEYVIGNKDVTFHAVWTVNALSSLVISSADVLNGGTIEAAYATISMSADAGAEIRYTMDGSEPTSASLLYTAPFVADGMNVTIKAIAMRDNYFDSAVATFSFARKPYSLSECLGMDGVDVTTGGDSMWGRVLGDEAYDGVAALKSGSLDNGQTNWVQVVVSGFGTVSFRWKVSSEGLSRGKRRDGCIFTVDGEEVAWSDGTTNVWTQVTVEVPLPGAHTLKWAYGKNGNTTSAGDDCAWLADVVWAQGVDPSVPHWAIVYENLKGAANPNPSKYYEGYGESFQPLSDVSGYTFAGWTPNSIPVNATGDKTVTANWVANTYVIRFDANDGIGTMADQSMTYDVFAAVRSNEFSRVGYDFCGWRLSRDGAIVYSDGEEVSNLTLEPNDVVMLYAAWEPKSYAINYDGTRGAANANPISYTVEDSITFEPLASVMGYTFVGWSPASIPVGTIGDITVTAQWKSEWTLGYLVSGGIAQISHGGSKNWYEQSSVTHGSEFAWRSGAIGNSQTSWMEIQVQGATKISFWWKVSSESGCDELSWTLDGIRQGSAISGVRSWLKISQPITTGAHTLRFIYAKDGSDSANDDCGYVADIVFECPETIVVTFDLGDHGTRTGGGGLSQEIEFGGVPVFPVVSPDYGWRFVGWPSTEGFFVDTVVSACYEAIPYTITYQETRGAANDNPPSYTIEDALNFAPLADIDDYAFAGWTPSAITAGTTGDKVVTANWNWMPEDALVDSSITGGKALTVDAEWVKTELDQTFGAGKRQSFVAKFGDNFAAALTKKTGKRDGAGNELAVWHDYVAGTDPTDVNSTFQAKIEFKEGMPVVEWEPNLNSNGVQRVYTVYGKTTLADNWHSPTNETDHFFKVDVAMPRDGTITFNAGVGTSVDPIAIQIGRSIGELPAATRQGYDFLGWFTESEGGIEITPETIVTDDMTIFAHWKKSVDADLVHRWSFNGDLTDSIGGQTATIVGGVTTDGHKYSTPGGSSGSAYIDLGNWILPTNGSPVTIEMWVTQDANIDWGRIFCWGAMPTEGVFQSAKNQYASEWIQMRWDGVCDAAGVSANLNSFSVGSEYHVATVLEPLGNGRWKATYYAKNATTGTTISTASSNLKAGWSLQDFQQTDMVLGQTLTTWDNCSKNSYNELRIWKKAMTEAELAASVVAGPDADL